MQRACLVALMVLATGCRVERTWFGQIEMTRGEVREDVWVASNVGDVLPGHEARNCASPSIGFVSEGLAVTLVDWDEWAGECWALAEVELGADAPPTSRAEFVFSYDACQVDGGCPDEHRNRNETRALTVIAR